MSCASPSTHRADRNQYYPRGDKVGVFNLDLEAPPARRRMSETHPRRMSLTEQDKRLNIWSTASGKHVRAYKVEPSTPQSAEPLASSSAEAAEAPGGGVTTPGDVAAIAGGSSVGGGGGGGSGAKDEAGGELFKVDLDPTGMYAAACSFDKVCARRHSSMACPSLEPLSRPADLFVNGDAGTPKSVIQIGHDAVADSFGVPAP